jgi:hypothetical protein
METLLTEVVGFLQLQKPYKITLKPRVYKGNTAVYWGVYRKGVLVSHNIQISVVKLSSDIRGLETIIAHELIHAWQEENGITEIHCKQFIKKSRQIEKLFGIPNIYLKEYDK